MNSRSKGKRGELEAAREIERIGLGAARRGQQFSGVEGKDVVHSIPGVHIEVKRVESLSLYPAVEQAIRDAGGDLPVVLHRRNRKPWLFVVRSEDLVEFARSVVVRAEHVGVISE